MDETTIDRIAQRSYDRSSNLSTTEYPWEELSKGNKERVREVVRDMLAAMDDLGLQVTPKPTERDAQNERMRKLVEADRQDRGCRCPILRVGDYCPVHGG